MIRRRLLTGTVLNLAAKVVAVGTWFLLTPFLLEHLGATGYAVWVLLTSVAWYGFLLDFGFGGAVVKYVAEHVARGERAAAREVVASATWLFTGLAVATVAAGVVVAPLLVRLLDLPSSGYGDAESLIVMTAANIAITLAMTPAFAVLRGLQRYDLDSGVHITATFTEASGVVVALLAGGGLHGMVAAFIPINVVTWCVVTWVVRRTAPDLGLRWRGARLTAVRRLASFSGSLFVIQSAGRLETKTDEFVIALFRALSAVTPYALARKLAELTEMVVVQCVQVAMPLASELHAGADATRLRRLYVTASRTALAIAVPAALMLGLLGGDVLSAWVGQSYAAYSPVLALLAVAYLFRSGQRAAVEILQGMARHHLVAAVAFFSAAANVILSVLLLPVLGLPGVALGTLIPSGAALFVVMPYANRTLGVSPRVALNEIWMPALLPALPAAAMLWIVRESLEWSPLATVVAGAVVTAIVYGGAYVAMPAAVVERALAADVIAAARPSARRLRTRARAGRITLKLLLRNLYAAALNRLPDSWFEPVRRAYVASSDGSLRRRILCALLRCLRYKSPDPARSSFELADAPLIRLANVNSIVIRHLYWFGMSGWEGTEIRAWQYFCSRATRILEIGANVGFYSVCGARSAPHAHYTAVEPHPRTAGILRRNLELNHLTHVDVVEAAVVGLATSERMTLVVPLADQDETPPGSFLQDGVEVALAGRVSYDVSVRDIHDLLTDVDLLKLDVEGYEFEILNPIRTFLLEQRPTLLVEVLPEARKLHRLIGDLVESGAYRAYVSGPVSLVEIDPADIAEGRLQRRYRTRDVFLCRADRDLPADEVVGARAPAPFEPVPA
jgi:FkbM family methyltransferase